KSCKRLKNGGVLYDLDSPTSALWLRTLDVMKAFLEHFRGHNCQLKTHFYAILAEFVPTACRADDDHYLHGIEHFNNYDPGNIESACWIKALERRHPNQRVAHLIVRFNAPVLVNNAIRKGIIIAGKRVNARKLISEPRRCLKCQKVGVPHISSECKSIHDTCGSCTSIGHKTVDCEVDPDDYQCANCQASGCTDWRGHAAWDHTCPVFQEHRRKMADRQPESKYRYFPTADPATW
ncbi:hypothetical protein BKA93DRAFT_692324, partial [Sparassis latifolia]